MGLFFVWSFFAALFFLSVQKGQCALIVGGVVSIPHSRPYMAALGHFTCGGTLIDEGWVLTAAHCFPTKSKYVVLGAHSQSNKNERRQNINVTNVFVYPGYNKMTFEHDIMLLKLQKNAVLNQNVQVLRPPTTSDDVQPGTSCLVTGWGRTGRKMSPSDELHEVNVTVFDRNICNRQSHRIRLTIDMLCAGDNRSEKGFCSGDSGGPLVCNGKQRGIVSFRRSNKCADPKFPGVYTHLTGKYLTWIRNTMKGTY